MIVTNFNGNREPKLKLFYSIINTCKQEMLLLNRFEITHNQKKKVVTIVLAIVLKVATY